MKGNALEVYRNGRKIAVIGIQRSGVLGGVVEVRKNKRGAGSVELLLHGLENIGTTKIKFLNWDSLPLLVGDEVTFRIVTSSKIDTPTDSRTETRSSQDDVRYRQYVELKKYFSGKKPL